MSEESLNDQVVLVDEQGAEIGIMPKLEVHEKGLLHRAFSVFIFNTKGELLLQQRALSKYHSPGVWSNTCCSHPFPGEDVRVAAMRRLKEEMGFTCPVDFAFHFTYKALVDRGLTEHEFDYVFFGSTDTNPRINTDEVQDWKYVNIDYLQQDIEDNPDRYSEWLKIVFGRVLLYLKNGHV